MQNNCNKGTCTYCFQDDQFKTGQAIYRWAIQLNASSLSDWPLCMVTLLRLMGVGVVGSWRNWLGWTSLHSKTSGYWTAALYSELYVT